MSILSREKWERFVFKKNLRGDEALELVKQDGLLLRYVTEQTPEICLAAVKQDGWALEYVEERFLDGPEDTTLSSSDEITVNGVKYRKVLT